jgi:hypothetical protein
MRPRQGGGRRFPGGGQYADGTISTRLLGLLQASIGEA